MKLRLLATPEPAGSSLDELLGGVEVRPGELREPLERQIPHAFAQMAVRLGVPLELAVATVIERSLAIGLFLPRGADVRALDQHAAAATMTGRPSPDVADYARRLIAALQGRAAATPRNTRAVTIPVRVADHMRARQVFPELDPGSIRVALQWELAAMASGLTVAEWALRETLRGYADADAATCRHSVAAEKTA